MGMEAPPFVVTAWRDADELLRLRRDLCWKFGSEGDDRRQSAVNKVHAWKARKQELPLLLESTVDIIDAILQDERGNIPHSALRLVYATAIARFVTGYSDTQLDLKRSRPDWLPSDPTTPFLDFPPSLLETRHSIVHRQFPSLAELKKSASQSLDWLREWYWSRLDVALSQPTLSSRRGDILVEAGVSLGSQELKERFQAVLKSYMKSRKAELKSGVKNAKKESRAAETAASTVSEICILHSSYQNVLLRLLVDEKTIIPADRKMGDSMAGAFLLWSPFVMNLSSIVHGFQRYFGDRLLTGLNNHCEPEPVREAMLEWLTHIFTLDSWKRKGDRSVESGQPVQQMLERIFTEPTSWNLRLAEALVQHENTPNQEQWKLILDAARDEELGMDVGAVLPVTKEREEQMDKKSRQGKVSGPQKVLGLWRPKPIGVLPVGWEDSE